MIGSRDLRAWLVAQRQPNQTQKEFGETVGISQSTVSKLENDPNYSFDFETVIALATKAGFNKLSTFVAYLETTPPEYLQRALERINDQAAPSDESSPLSPPDEIALRVLRGFVDELTHALQVAMGRAEETRRPLSSVRPPASGRR